MKIFFAFGTVALALSAGALHAQSADLAPKPPTQATLAAQAKARAALPKETGQDLEFAKRGFLATLPDPIIRSADSKPLWNLDAYAWMTGEAPSTVNPSLWRHMNVLRQHGLYKVRDGMWQIRGFDISNMTIIAGKTGWILIDPLSRKEIAAAAMGLVNAKLGARPVKAVIYTHSHADHFGGVRGVTAEADAKAGKVAIIAPEHFMEETGSENVIAGPAMGRRAQYQFGLGLKPSAQGTIGSGIGPGLSGGEMTLITPTDTIKSTGEKRVLDGITLEFQMVPESEAPAELNVMLPDQRTLVIGEIATCSQHNILTPRGALVRNTAKWAVYLTEALRLYADRTDTIAASHCWPQFGKERTREYLTLQRDNYKFLHDQSVRLMNNGLNATEIAEQIVPPPGLAREWFTRGYYGTYNHNAKAVYQRYLGWYDAVPANLNPHIPTERAKRMVSAIGGSARVITLAKTAIADGDYRWSSDLLNQLVFAEPENAQARGLLADSYEQQGYQSESALWRNMFLLAAKELRQGIEIAGDLVSTDTIAAMPTAMMLDAIATRLNPAVIGEQRLTLNFNLTDRSEKAAISTSNAVMVSEMDQSHNTPRATLSGPRRLFLGLLFQKIPLSMLEGAGLKVEGDRTAIEAFQAAIEAPAPNFNIATP
jgi:alkyl sulfatase BDS1-like metallo-beta-lactamase superfamily hydrolase